MEDAEILCQIKGKAPVWADAVLGVFGAVGGSHWSERVVNYLHLQYLLISLITSLGVEKRWKEKNGEKIMGAYELTKYDHFINPIFIKDVKSELILLIFSLVCLWILVPAIFNSDRWVVMVFNFNISLYYLYPVIVGLICLLYIFRKVFKYYSRAVFHFYFKDNFLVLNIFEFKSVQFNTFNFVLDKYRIGHWNGFKKEYFNCVGIEVNKKVYLIPVADGKQDELVKLLLDHGGKQTYY